jgi:hypothetical protein
MATYTVVPVKPNYYSVYRYHAKIIDDTGKEIATTMTDTKWGRRLSVWWKIRQYEKKIESEKSFTVVSKFTESR